MYPRVVILTSNAQAHPLLPSGSSGLLNGPIELGVGLGYVLGDFFSALFNLRDCGLLLYHQGLEILEELRKLNHLSFNLLNVLVALGNVACHRLRLTTAIALDQSRAEDLLVVGIFHSFPHFGIRGIWADNAILSSHLFLRRFSELSLDLLVLIDGGLQSAIHLANLWRIARISRLGLLLDVLDSAHQPSVLGHDAVPRAVNFNAQRRLRRGICVGQVARLKTSQTLQVRFNLIDGLVNCSTFIEDSVGIGAVHVSHLCNRGLAGFQSIHVNQEMCTISTCCLFFVGITAAPLLRCLRSATSMGWLIGVIAVIATLTVGIARLSVRVIGAVALPALTALIALIALTAWLAITLIVLSAMLATAP